MSKSKPMGLVFNRNLVVCINLKSLNDKQLLIISNDYSLDLSALLELKSKNYSKIWAEKLGEYVIAYSINDEFVVTTQYSPISKKDYMFLLKMNPVEIKIGKKNSEKKIQSICEKLTYNDIVSECLGADIDFSEN